MLNLRVRTVLITRSMATHGQCIYDNINSADAAVHVGHSARKQPLFTILSPNQHNYNPIKGPLELQLHCLSNLVLLIPRHGFAMVKQQSF